mgnify:CR=1 FL=1
MPFWKKKIPEAPNINVDEKAYFKWFIQYDERLEFFRRPFSNIEQFSNAGARQSYEEFKPFRGEPEKIFERVGELARAYQDDILPAIGQDCRGYLQLPSDGAGAVASVVCRMECGRQLLINKYHHKTSIDLDNIARGKR